VFPLLAVEHMLALASCPSHFVVLPVAVAVPAVGRWTVMLVIIVEERGVRALVELDASEGGLGGRATQKGDTVQLAWEGFVNCSTGESEGEGEGDGGEWTEVKSGELERCLRTSLSPRFCPLP